MGSRYPQHSWDELSSSAVTSSSTESYPWIATAQTLAVPLGYQPYAGGSESAINSGDARMSKSPVPLDAELLRTGSVERRLNRDGQPAKRRGPKPDNKPAQTRRQELNRQAQRTHREKKENYIKDLETQNAQLRTIIKERDAVLLENEKLKGILRANGIPYPNRAPEVAPSYADTGGNSALFSPSPVRRHHQPLSSTSPVPPLGLGPQTGQEDFYRTTSLAIQQNMLIHGQPQSENMMAYDQLDVGYIPNVQQDPSEAEIQLQRQHQGQSAQQQQHQQQPQDLRRPSYSMGFQP